ncbi:5-formyltetrahydrofolate cyclo-ligase [Porcipelethomonas sp.]|uniref:5-formyltetrahydrofolate cyclo-ligase n=1 Tax=Porcipelethomonas sp. TaxID=2981675 RepID=UPI003EF58E72
MCGNIKAQLRQDIKYMRKHMNPDIKKNSDEEIYNNLLTLDVFKKAELILAYMSTNIEINTDKIIEYCLNSSKTVALPRCIENNRMDFYYYNKKADLEKSAYGIYEPYPDKNNLLYSYENALCIVPGLAFDKKGYRLGYGGGYYDRFLSEHKNIITVGLCYQENIKDKLIRNEYDIHVNYIVTEKSMEVCNG